MARKKTGPKKKGAYEWSGEISRIIPLQDNHCYIQDEKGKLHHLQRDSVESITLMRNLDEIMEGKITRELTLLGWEDILREVHDPS